ncbi:hypothetical protein PN36_05040 [Candidatus Thiomargarita nelsonii]|uniref:Glycosyltransferase RgtA/B/C/D-like domain-containing protein n=1 Tax=Candidatus Thiomargarita nelsonii TaxID=1003181 RepID=A0A0A6PJC0_9GAMM|nr:hypothetical protein PN36_05040 [Candidatus Thiomargarita nelsonii]
MSIIKNKLKLISTESDRLTVLFLCFLILLYREPDGFINPQFWAEDGEIFFQQNLILGFSALLEPYSGYLHLIPRLISYLTGFLPISFAPALYNFSALVITLFIINYLFSSRIHLPFKPLLAIAVVLVPYNGEIMMSLTNIQWFLPILLILLIIQDKPNTRKQLLLDTLMITAIGLTSPFVALFLPLFIFRLIYICRSHYSVYLLSIALLLALIQGYFIWQTTVGLPTFSEDYDNYGFKVLIPILALRLSGTLFFGDYLSSAFNFYGLTGLAIILPTGLLILAVSKPPHRQLPIIVFMMGGLIILFATFYKLKNNLPILVSFDNGYRYFYSLHLFIIWSLIIYLDSVIKYVSALLLLMALLSAFTHFQVSPLKDFHWEKYSQQIERGEAVKVPINPEGWFVSIPRPK